MDDSLATAIIEAIAETKGVEPAELDLVLTEYIDPDALSQLTEHKNSIWMLTFNIPDHEVTVTSDGDVFVDNQQPDDTVGI